MAVHAGPDIVTDGLILHLDAANARSYPGSGTVWRDLTGNGYNATLNGPTFLSSDSGVISFDGVNDSASTGNIDLSGTNRITLEMFCKLNSYVETVGSTKIMFELSNNFNSTNSGFVMGYADNSNTNAVGTLYSVVLAVNGNTTYNISSFDKNLVNDLKWHHWICVFDKSVSGAGSQECSLYIDGTLRSVVYTPSNTYRGDNSNNFGNLPFFIGARNSSSFFSHMNLACVRIYNRLLTQSEISNNYNALRGRFGLQ